MMSIFELSIYCSIIEEAWKQSGILRLRTDSPVDTKWSESLEAVVYTTQKYLSQATGSAGRLVESRVGFYVLIPWEGEVLSGPIAGRRNAVRLSIHEGQDSKFTAANKG